MILHYLSCSDWTHTFCYYYWSFAFSDTFFSPPRIERKIATISLESRDGPVRLGDGERGRKKKVKVKTFVFQFCYLMRKLFSCFSTRPKIRQQQW